MISFFILSLFLATITVAYLLFKTTDIKKSQIIALIIGAPVLLVLIYLQIGAPHHLVAQSESPLNQQKSENSDSSIAGLNNLNPEKIKFAINKLKENIENDPADINSLNLLSNSYMLIEQHSEAAATLEKLISLGQNDVETLLKTINSYNFAEQGRINERAYQLIKDLLSKAPKHPQGLWVAGMSEMQRNNTVDAKNYWNQLIPILEGTPQQQELMNIVAQLDNEPIQQNSEKLTATIQVTITLSDDFDRSKAQANDLVFVFATAKNGPPAPLAAKRLTVADLPITVQLSEQDAMLPQMTITQFDDIVLSAKISKTGNPANKEGDINSQSIAITMSNLKSNYTLMIQ